MFHKSNKDNADKAVIEVFIHIVRRVSVTNPVETNAMHDNQMFHKSKKDNVDKAVMEEDGKGIQHGTMKLMEEEGKGKGFYTKSRKSALDHGLRESWYGVLALRGWSLSLEVVRCVFSRS
ncbi:hypothetical protein AMTR_s00044p00151550 [Amborella trichopoda]|uniref:Uncharacterized protein n=1 Tax=Amborella trichopoda TaxID=13333 RepID=U5D6Z7_AMBTC|nr:hypothetical protein AMTR_s00044p00151550 [Amborella trichopoda]